MLTTGVYDHRIDVWALGILTYECLCGVPPFEVPDSVEDTHEKIKAGAVVFPEEIAISDEAKDLVNRLLQKSAEDRPTLAEGLEHPFVARAVPIS